MIRTPFRILPSRGLEITALGWMTAACAAALVAGVAVLPMASQGGGFGTVALLLIGISAR